MFSQPSQIASAVNCSLFVLSEQPSVQLVLIEQLLLEDGPNLKESLAFADFQPALLLQQGHVLK